MSLRRRGYLYLNQEKLKFLNRFRKVAETAFQNITVTESNNFQPEGSKEARDWEEIEIAKNKLVKLARLHMGYSEKTVAVDILSGLNVVWRKNRSHAFQITKTTQ